MDIDVDATAAATAAPLSLLTSSSLLTTTTPIIVWLHSLVRYFYHIHRFSHVKMLLLMVWDQVNT